MRGFPQICKGLNKRFCDREKLCLSLVLLTVQGNYQKKMELDLCRSHLLKILESYICTFSDCELEDKAFTSRQEWFKHKANCHRIRWAGCVTGLFWQGYGNKQETLYHMDLQHKEIIRPPLDSYDFAFQPPKFKEGSTNAHSAWKGTCISTLI